MTGKPDPRTYQIPRLRKRCDLLTWTPNTVMAMPSMTYLSHDISVCIKDQLPTALEASAQLDLIVDVFYPCVHPCGPHPVCPSIHFSGPGPALCLCSWTQLFSFTLKAVMQSSESSSFLQVVSLGSFLYPCGFCLHLYLSTSGTS